MNVRFSFKSVLFFKLVFLMSSKFELKKRKKSQKNICPKFSINDFLDSLPNLHYKSSKSSLEKKNIFFLLFFVI